MVGVWGPHRPLSRICEAVRAAANGCRGSCVGVDVDVDVGDGYAMRRRG